MEKYLNITKPSYSEQVLPVPWYFARCSALDTASTQFYTLRILILTMGRCHLHGKTENSGWKIKWFAPFRLGSFRKYGL